MQVPRRRNETLSQWASRFIEEAGLGTMEVPCLNRSCRFHQDPSQGGVSHNIQDHPALEESLVENQCRS